MKIFDVLLSESKGEIIANVSKMFQRRIGNILNSSDILSSTCNSIPLTNVLFI
jgi:hypothetical protein